MIRIKTEATVVKPDEEFFCPICKDETLEGGGDGMCTCANCGTQFKFTTKNGKMYREKI